MFAKITLATSIKSRLHYHENKVEQKRAECLYAGNFTSDYHQLTRKELLYQFERRNNANQHVQKNTANFLLSFHPSEKLSNQELTKIAREYLKRIGFEKQPYLVYRHNDTPHPHLHIIASNIQAGGKKLYLKKADFFLSKEVTKDLEIKHALIPAGERVTKELDKDYSLQKFVYGQTPVWPTITKVVNEVIPQYKYTSLDELNAVLGLYNVKATPVENPKTAHQFNGLLYRGLKSDGTLDHGYIEARHFAIKPTLKNLERKFSLNQHLREPDRQRLLNAIDRTLFNNNLSLSAFQDELRSRRISTVLQPGTIWYIDHQTKAVFEGSTLGGQYTAPAIAQRCISEEIYSKQQLKQQETLRLRLPSL